MILVLRVLIADDEAKICQLIRVLGQWDTYGLEIVGMASNGCEAVEMIQTLKPDILITDIRMPGCDGLEVIRQGLKCVPWMQVMIISGYAQFDYAQTALQYGVGEYLLKPINREALNHALEKMSSRATTLKKRETEMQTIRSSHQDDRMLLRSKLITDLVSGTFSATSKADMQKYYRYSISEGLLGVFLLKVDYDTASFGKASMDIVCAKALSALENGLSGAFHDVVLGCYDHTVIGVVHYAEKESTRLRGRLRDALNQLVAQKSLWNTVDFSLSLGTPCTEIINLPEAYRSARIIASQRLVEGTGRLLEERSFHPTQPNLPLQKDYDAAMAHAIDVMDFDRADEAVDALRRAAKEQGLSGQKYLDLVRGAALLLLTRLGIENRDELLQVFEHQCDHCGSLDALFAGLKTLQRQQIEEILRRRKAQDIQPVRAAKQYVQKHFAQPISLETVSDEIGLSVNYFSTLFKKETGEGFAKYLTRIRMEEARALLKETRLPVADICTKVGYNDIKHFKRTFKQETGLSPNEYRKVYG